MLASFPWYDLPSVQWANEALWRATGFPGKLIRHRAARDLWYDPDLLVTQACGLDLFLSDAPIEPVAAPVFDLDCEAGVYYSYIVGNMRGSVAAVNSLSSRSGYTALLTVCNPEKVIVTGSHIASLGAIQAGHAEVAAIDAVTWSILARDNPGCLTGLEVVERSAVCLSPPYVVKSDADRENMFVCLRRAVLSPASMLARKALFLKDVLPVQKHDYLPILTEYESVVREGVSATIENGHTAK